MRAVLTLLLEVTVTEGCLMEGNTSIQTFDLEIDVLSLTMRSTNVNTCSMTDLQETSTPSFITIYIFALVDPYLFAVKFVSP